MSSSDIEQYVLDLYDEHVAVVGDEVKVSEAKAAIHRQVVDRLAETDRLLDREADMLIDSAVGRERGRRSRGLRKQIGYILDAFEDHDGAYVDPLLGKAFPLGDEAGHDKLLRNWTPENFRDVVVTRYRVAAESTAAASDLDAAVQQLLDRMTAGGAATLGDLA